MKMKKAVRILMVLVLALVMMIGIGFVYLYRNGMSGIANTTEAKEGQTRVACVGDSVTYGHGTSNWPNNTYPALLQSMLGESYHVNNYGVSSFAVQSSADRPYATLKHYQESLAYNGDIVVFMMGTNDSKPENWIDEKTFREDLLQILDSYGDAKIVLCTVPSAFFLDGQTEGVTNHDIQPEVVNRIAEVIRQIAEERGYALVDIHALTVQHPEWFAKDGVHPSNEGAAGIAQAVYGTIINLETENET